MMALVATYLDKLDPNSAIMAYQRFRDTSSRSVVDSSLSSQNRNLFKVDSEYNSSEQVLKLLLIFSSYDTTLIELPKQVDDGKGLAGTVADVNDANKRGPLIFTAREGKTDLCNYLVEELKSSDKECILARNPENSFRPTPATVVHDPTLPITKKYPSIRSAERNDWRNNDYTGKNEHLLESGQLGICNDPYCTTCLTYCYLKARQKISMSSDIFDHKGNSPKVGIQGKKWNSEATEKLKGLELCRHSSEYWELGDNIDVLAVCVICNLQTVV
ncbi:hypothetical protein FXO37_20179 [Capsicum annuum]|nr:hypothetical protein FXO37_20179 [Capsicum annuum]